MRRDLPYYELLEEVRRLPEIGVLRRISLRDIFAFVKHLKERRGEQYMACLRQMDRELRTMALLAETKKRNVR